jgi:hypothetical protein
LNARVAVREGHIENNDSSSRPNRMDDEKPKWGRGYELTRRPIPPRTESARLIGSYLVVRFAFERYAQQPPCLLLPGVARGECGGGADDE